MKWNSNLYDNAQNYVSEYGKNLIHLIPKLKNISILDLGCGTGTLTNDIYINISKNIIGIDSSANMIKKAKEKYPKVNFAVCDACNITYNKKFDVVFSNACFHWIKDQNKLHRNIYNALNKDGQLICEFGANGNIERIIKSFTRALKIFEDNYINPFYFPTNSEYAKILNVNGFKINSICDYDRPTILNNGRIGLRQFASQFFSDSIKNYDIEKREKLFSFIENDLEDMFDGQNWIADYRRIRVTAIKSEDALW